MNKGISHIDEISQFGTDCNYSLWFPWLHYHSDEVVNLFIKTIGAELLVRDTSSTIVELLHRIKKNNKTLQLFQRGLYEAFSRLNAGELWFFSVNAYIGDIWNVTFRETIEWVMARFKKRYRHQITIEVVETPYGDIDGKFIDNIIWLRHHGFGIAIDDYDLFGDEDNNVSEDILRAIWKHCTKIKLDWRITKTLIKQKTIRRQLLSLRSRYPKSKIVAEWIRNRADLLTLIGVVDQFQFTTHKILGEWIICLSETL